MTFTFQIRTPEILQDVPAGPNNSLVSELVPQYKKFTVEQGTSLLFVGANGSGKTRLAVNIEAHFKDSAHRISAHRALKLNPNVPKIKESVALKGLRTGNANENALINHRSTSRWQSKEAINLLDDFDFLIQALFADQANVSLQTHNALRNNTFDKAKPTNFERLIEIWGKVLPHRQLIISGDDIMVSADDNSPPYPAAEMSDGERAAFYLIGQTITARDNSLIIFDEPELHIHRSIMSPLWDELEAARPDCGMVFISHDLEFVASRKGQKYVLKSFSRNQIWELEEVPEETGFSEETTTLILGSRKPILFIEGTNESLDRAIYRACFPSWTVIPRNSCEEVIHSVRTMRANSSLTRVTCSGVVDADAYNDSEIDFFATNGIGVLPVSEIENLLLLPNVISEIIKADGYNTSEIDKKRNEIFDALFEQAGLSKTQLPIVLRYCRRRIDRVLKKIDLSEAKDIATLNKTYSERTNELDINDLASTARNAIEQSIATRDVAELLKWYDNKGVLAIACKAKSTTKAQFEQWIVRTLRNNSAPELTEAIKGYLPTLNAQ